MAENASRCGEEAKRRTQLGKKTKDEQRPSGRHVDIHRLIVMPSAWVVRPPSLSIGVVLARKIRPPWYDNILDGSVFTARDVPGAIKDRVSQLCRVTGWPEIEQGP